MEEEKDGADDDPTTRTPHNVVGKKREPIGEVGCCGSWMAERINPLMDRKAVGAVLFGGFAMVALITQSVPSPTRAGCSVVQRSCSCSFSIVEQ